MSSFWSNLSLSISSNRRYVNLNLNTVLSYLFYCSILGWFFQRWSFLQIAMTCCSNIQCGPMKYCGNSVWFKTLSLCQSKPSCYKQVIFKVVIGKMFATKNRIVGCILSVGTSSLHLFIPLLMQQQISRKMKQAYTIGIMSAATHRLPISINIIRYSSI